MKKLAVNVLEWLAVLAHGVFVQHLRRYLSALSALSVFQTTASYLSLSPKDLLWPLVIVVFLSESNGRIIRGCGPAG